MEIRCFLFEVGGRGVTFSTLFILTTSFKGLIPVTKAYRCMLLLFTLLVSLNHSLLSTPIPCQNRGIFCMPVSVCGPGFYPVLNPVYVLYNETLISFDRKCNPSQTMSQLI